MKKFLRFCFRAAHLFTEFMLLLFMGFAVYIGIVVSVAIPEPEDMSSLELERETVGEHQYRIGNNWSVLNDHGIWEAYVEGEPFERGVIYGKLLQESVHAQEVFFVDQIEKIVPSATWRFFLKVMIAYFNRDMDHYVPYEYQEEIYGVSFSFSDEFDYVGPKYYRILNYHAAHDIGHALEEYNMVGCTSFSVKDEFSENQQLLVGRNFDFYMGDEFSEDKVLTFVNPSEGHQFAMYSWAGLMGVVSGMNTEGVCVTINAAKSDLPTKTKTPISILTREILQYASNIDEAVEIAKKREVFVSETIMLTSANDNKTVLIEKSPEAVDVYESENGKVLCTNHYQSDHFEKTEINQENIKNSDSQYRYDRLTELISDKQPLNLDDAISILRNQKGTDNEDLGWGNPKAINQLIAHHSIVFEPQEHKMWISTAPYQLGNFICYDLDEVFSKAPSRDLNEQLYIDSLTVAEDPFVKTKTYQNFEYFKTIKKKLFDSYMLGIEFNLSDLERERYINSNKNSYVTYMTLGQYYLDLEKFDLAKGYFEEALTKEVASINEENKIKNLIDECKH
ncbi:MAG: C45 family peptidase [Flavobacteriales bacterium]|nr:C45 family peptidase [Flavobacteriales bacterium]